MPPYGLIRDFKIAAAVLEVEIKRRRDFAATAFDRHDEEESLKAISVMKEYVATAETCVESDTFMAGVHLRAAQALLRALEAKNKEA